jgi:hypothetical protein
MTSIAFTSNVTMSQDGSSLFRSFGSPTSVPDSDVSFLSYYLKCCNLGCGINAIQTIEVMDYKSAHLQPAHIQQAIYQLALSEFNPVRLVNRIVFLDDANILLPPDTGNGFYERSVVSQVQNLPYSDLEQSQLNVRKFMFCTTPWLEAFCIGPLYRYYQNQCRLNESIAIASPLQCSQGIPESVEGATGRCPCRHHDQQQTSPTKVVLCDGCHRIGCGTRRYQCQVCSNCNLCEDCYNDSESHDQTHAFQIIVAGDHARPIRLSPRIQAVTAELDYEKDDIPMADAVPIEDVNPGMDLSTMGHCFIPGQTVRLTGLTMARRLNGCIAVVEGSAFNLIIVRLVNQQNEKYAFKPEDLKLIG